MSWICCPCDATLYLWCSRSVSFFSLHASKLKGIVIFYLFIYFLQINTSISTSFRHTLESTPSKSCGIWWASFIKFLKDLLTCKKALQSASFAGGVARCYPWIIWTKSIDEYVFILLQLSCFHVLNQLVWCQQWDSDH